MSLSHPSIGPPDSLNAEVASRIVNLLWQRGGPWLAKVDVRFHGGTATLSGKVRTFYERQLCTACCRRVPGVQRVVDELQVDYATATVIGTIKSVSNAASLDAT